MSSRTIAIPKITLSISCVLSTREIICVSIVALQSKIVENANFGSYIDRAVQKILTDSNADPATEFGQAQDLCAAEALDAFNEANKR